MASVPFTRAQRPAGDDPEREHEDKEDSSGADCHESFEDESRVEVDAVESADAARTGVREELAVEQHDATDQVEA